MRKCNVIENYDIMNYEIMNYFCHNTFQEYGWVHQIEDLFTHHADLTNVTFPINLTFLTNDDLIMSTFFKRTMSFRYTWTPLSRSASSSSRVPF